MKDGTSMRTHPDGRGVRPVGDAGRGRHRGLRTRILAAVVLATLAWVAYGIWALAARGGHRARFVLAAEALRRAHEEVRSRGAFTHDRPGDRVYRYTNRFTVEGKVLECALAVESVDLLLRERGVLAMTPEGALVWVDAEGGPMFLGDGPAFSFPPGF